MLPSDENRIIEEAKLAYSPIGKVFWKQTKTTEEQRKKNKLKQLKSMENN